MIYAVNTRTKEHRVPKNPEMATPGEVVDGKKYGDKWLMVEADADGWIEWRGGECPLPDGAHASVLYANGRKKTGKALNPNHNMEQSFWTRDYGNSWNIIAYRPILDTNPSEPEAPQWDGDSWPIPIGNECLFDTPDEYGINSTWMNAKVVGHDGPACVVAVDGDGYHGSASRGDFRPIRSEEDMAVEEMMRVTAIAARIGEDVAERYARALYRAGYRKTAADGEDV